MNMLTKTRSSQKSPVQGKCKPISLICDEQEAIENNTKNDDYNYEIKTFIEISKYFASPLKKTASYICENELVAYPKTFRFEYKRGNVTTEHIKFSNLILEPVFIKFYKLMPEIEQIKFINLSLSRSKRIPPGLSFNLGFVYNDANENKISSAKMVFVASRNTSTPCYQICEIHLLIAGQNVNFKKHNL